MWRGPVADYITRFCSSQDFCRVFYFYFYFYFSPSSAIQVFLLVVRWSTVDLEEIICLVIFFFGVGKEGVDI